MITVKRLQIVMDLAKESIKPWHTGLELALLLQLDNGRVVE